MLPDSSVHRRRLAALVAAVDRPVAVFGMGGALGAGTRSHGGLRYLTGWNGHESASLLLVDGDRVQLVSPNPFMAAMAQETHAALRPVCAPLEAWGATMRRFFGALDHVGAIGVEELPWTAARDLREWLDGCADVTPALDALRVVKDADEIARHRRGAAICDDLFAAAWGLVAAGETAREAQRALEARALAQGAEHCRTWLTVGRVADRARYWPEETGARATFGAQALFGVALTVEGQWAHGIRMAHWGPTPLAVARLTDAVMQGLEAGLAAVRPGRKLSAVVDAAMGARAAACKAFPKAAVEFFRFGHGLGCAYEDPILTNGFPQLFRTSPQPAADAGVTLRPGMVLVLHPNAFAPGVGGAALGEMVLVTETGGERLFAHPLTPARIDA